MEIMKPEIDEIRLQERRETAERVEREAEKRIKETTEHAIRVAVEMLRNLNLGNAEIKEALQKNYNL